MALTDNIVSYWKMDEASGKANDSVGSNNCTLAGGAALNQSGKINTAVQLYTSGTDYLTLDSATGLDITSACTVTAWVKLSSVGGGYHDAIFSKGTSAYFLTTQSSKCTAYFYIGGSWQILSSTTNIVDNTWHYIAMTYDGSYIRVYVDGSSDASPLSVSGSIATDGSASHIGTYTGASNPVGKIDEVGVWARALSSTEITELYNDGNGFQYPFDENSSSSSLMYSSSSKSSYSSSTSSSSSLMYSSSSESSSSTSFGLVTQTLYHTLIGQNHYNLVPFVFYGEDNFQNTGTNLLFTFHTQYDSIGYSGVKTPSNPTATTGTVYVPEKEDAYYRSEPVLYIDLITNKGIQQEIVTGQDTQTQVSNSNCSFVIPKFTWENTFPTSAGTQSGITYTHLKDATGSVWVGSEDHKVYKIEYNNYLTTKAYTLTLDSEVKEICAPQDNDNMYISTYDNLYKYTMSHYYRTDKTYSLYVNQRNKIFNKYREKMQLELSDDIWSVVPYGSSLNVRDELLVLQDKIAGFDNPFKIRWSSYHGYFIIAGTTMLWKWNGVTASILYEINDYRISDFSISNNGEICLLLISNSESIMRVLDRNLFRILFNTRITNGFFRFSDFCDSCFYAVAEMSGGTTSYKLAHHVYNIGDGTHSVTLSENAVTVYVSSSSEVEATAKMQVQYPSGGVLLYGQEITIRWVSTESITNLVKIELLKDTDVYATITSSTGNTGVYKWKVPTTIEEGNDYKIRITLLTANVNPDDSGTSPDPFSIAQYASSSSEQIVSDFGKLAGVKYDSFNNQVVIVTKDGYLGLFGLITLEFKGLFETGVTDINCIDVRNERIKEFGTISKVRLFVGSQPYYNDKWDSGEVSTTLTSMYYGGGDNLTKGETYYVNIQIYSSTLGWSETQTREFVMQ